MVGDIAPVLAGNCGHLMTEQAVAPHCPAYIVPIFLVAVVAVPVVTRTPEPGVGSRLARRVACNTLGLGVAGRAGLAINPCPVTVAPNPPG